MGLIMAIRELFEPLIISVEEARKKLFGTRERPTTLRYFPGELVKTTWGVAREIPKIPIRVGASLLDIPVRLTTKKGIRQFDVPLLGPVKTYQQEAEERAERIVAGEQPLWHAVRPFVEVPLDVVMTAGMAKAGVKGVKALYRKIPKATKVIRYYGTQSGPNTDTFRGGTWFTSRGSKLYDFSDIVGIGGKRTLKGGIQIKKPLVIKDAELLEGSFNVINQGYENFLPPLQRKLANEFYRKTVGEMEPGILVCESRTAFNSLIRNILTRNKTPVFQINKVIKSTNPYDATMDLIISKGLTKRGYDALILQQAGDTHIFKLAPTKVLKLFKTL